MYANGLRNPESARCQSEYSIYGRLSVVRRIRPAMKLKSTTCPFPRAHGTIRKRCCKYALGNSEFYGQGTAPAHLISRSKIVAAQAGHDIDLQACPSELYHPIRQQVRATRMYQAFPLIPGRADKFWHRRCKAVTTGVIKSEPLRHRSAG